MATKTELTDPELAGVEIDGVTRGAFILRGALAASAIYGTSTVGPFVSSALAAGDGGDVAILNFALTLEYLESAFYKKALGLHLSSETRQFAQTFGDDETQHVAALQKAIQSLGGKPGAKPTFSFPITDEKSFLTLAQKLEDTGVEAYNGAGPKIKSKKILAAAGSIVQIEGRHAAIIRILNGAFPAPHTFDRTANAAQVAARIAPLIKGQPPHSPPRFTG